MAQCDQSMLHWSFLTLTTKRSCVCGVGKDYTLNETASVNETKRTAALADNAVPLMQFRVGGRVKSVPAPGHPRDGETTLVPLSIHWQLYNNNINQRIKERRSPLTPFTQSLNAAAAFGAIRVQSWCRFLRFLLSFSFWQPSFFIFTFNQNLN